MAGRHRMSTRRGTTSLATFRHQSGSSPSSLKCAPSNSASQRAWSAGWQVPPVPAVCTRSWGYAHGRVSSATTGPHSVPLE
jgi:hypothetical protein